jgi:hypothetical protein
MKLLTVITFSMSLFSLAAYNTETVSTFCFFITSICYEKHAKEVDNAINKRPGEYISHSTIMTKAGMITSFIVYK